MGGLDCRHLITHLKPTEYTPVSLTTVATPHRGSPFMDWCADNIGIGKLQQKERELENLIRNIEDHTHNEMDRPQPQKPDKQAEASKSAFSMSLSSLPSSFTTLLLSLLDSPAYANLTSAYLNNIFNPHTPNDPNVRYFSVAGRIRNMNIFHPLWLPKMVLDGYEERERERIGDDWNFHDRWGNDGLVTVQSSKWGEFLGILEECDHWELRGARGIELSVWGGKEGDASSPTEGWNLGDWGRFVRAWKKEEKKARDAGAAVSNRQENDKDTEMVKAKRVEESEAGRDRGFADDVVKGSTDKLSAVFDWIVEQVPSRDRVGGPSTSTSRSAEKELKEKERESKKIAEKSDLATKADLERFYVALCRKLYDEGL
ncbi:hypothetical protein PHLCEN_2v4929 [Hermanssonia centrifuga]|uniref:Alpha/beta-hydrolase n=1 Tax=Hermanssonia centrifuga TaxID=98765 RepID=A0A2R6PG60_9APHY|nr:hypothetical protein PHLCEN_2v4929 [Hermanssonia centrifuga]